MVVATDVATGNVGTRSLLPIPPLFCSVYGSDGTSTLVITIVGGRFVVLVRAWGFPIPASLM